MTTEWPYGAYVIGPPVEDDAHFVGRQALIESVCRRVATDFEPGFLLTGPRRYGKTSVLKRLARRLSETAIVIHLDLPRLLPETENWTPGSVLATVLRRILEVANEIIPGGLPRRVYDNMRLADQSSFQHDVLPALYDAIPDARRLVIFLDEMEAAQALDPTSPDELLRAFSPTGGYRAPKAFLGVAWGRPFGRGSATVSSLYHSLQPYRVDRFDEVEFRQALTTPLRGAYSWDPALDHGYELVQGHPLFSAALGEAVLQKRQPGDSSPVSLSEVDAAIPRTVALALGWEDAWRQLSIEQRAFLRAVAEGGSPDLASVVERLRQWGAPTTPALFAPIIRGLIDDGLVEVESEAYRFQVPVIAQWVIHNVGPQEAVALLDQAEPIISQSAQTFEDRGFALHEAGTLEEAAAAYRIALEHDPTRLTAIRRLGEVLLLLDQPDEAITTLRAAPPDSFVQQLLAQALARRLERAEKTEDLQGILADLWRVDPELRMASGVAYLVARVEVHRWWHDLEADHWTHAEEATRRFVFDRGIAAIREQLIIEALSHARRWLENALESRVDLNVLVPVACVVVPYLLKESALLHTSLEHNADAVLARERREAWLHCYVTEVSTISTMANGAYRRLGKAGVPPLAIRRLLDCAPRGTDLAEPLVAIVDELATSSCIAELALEEPQASLVASGLLNWLPSAERGRRLKAACDDMVLNGSYGNPLVLRNILAVVPEVGTMRLDTLQDLSPQIATAFAGDLANAVTPLVDRFTTDPECEQFADARDLVGSWERFLLRLAEVCPNEADLLQSQFRQWADPRRDGSPSLESLSVGRQRLDADKVSALLGTNYSVIRRVPYRVEQVRGDTLSAWLVRRDEKEFLARVYAVETGEPALRGLLTYLWENERRLLSTLATRWEGRALPRLHLSRFDAERGVLLLLTDYIGTHTLRDLLRSGEIGRLRTKSRSQLWEQLVPLVQALAMIHRYGYLHRAVRPEHILVDQGAGHERPRQWLRLANFEWSIYLYGFAKANVPRSIGLSRYSAPEQLPVHLGVRDEQSHGEGFASDALTLGLLLYECLVEPLRESELQPVGLDYSPKAHAQWLRQIIRQVDRSYLDRKLFSEEAALLRGLLQPDPSRRESDLGSLLEDVVGLAAIESPDHATLDVSPLQLVATLGLTTDASIARFIPQRELGIEFNNSADVAGWIATQLENAEVRPNHGSSSPLLLMGRDLNFTVAPLNLRSVRHRHVGWLRIASADDRPAGPALGRIGCGVKIINYSRDMELGPLLRWPASWTPWFDAVDRAHEGMSAEEHAFVERVRLSVDLEHESLRRYVLPFSVVEYHAGVRPGDVETVRIKDGDTTTATGEIAKLVVQSIDRDDSWFDLGVVSDPVAPFDSARRWLHVDEDVKDDSVLLARNWSDGLTPPPLSGFIRPYSLLGHRTLRQRREEILTDLQHDPFLVRALQSPSGVFDDLSLPPSRRVFDRYLDPDKREICDAIQSRRPIFTVQGPPGTGKTKLAAEVILRTLSEHPSSRILVVCQSHEPLNHLLERVEAAFDEWQRTDPRIRRPGVVRLTSEERLDESRYGLEAVRIPREFHPSRVATRVMERATAWRPRDHESDITSPEALHIWRSFAADEAAQGLSRSLERRLVNSANVVYATANDRRLAAVKAGSFDLLIYEEAAKALPIEIIGPMRLARRWLLIGDQRQLPPFGIEQLQMTLEDWLRSRQDTQGDTPEDSTAAPQRDQDRKSKLAAEMMHLFRFFNLLHAQTGSIRDPALPPGSQGQAVQGLAGMLRTQWRMHPVIGTLVSDCFYESRIVNGDARLSTWRRHGFTSPPVVLNSAVVWLDTPAAVDEPMAHEDSAFGGGFENALEARVVLGFLRSLLGSNTAVRSLAVISPYRAQISLLRRLLRDYYFPSVGNLADRLHTADSFQGKQADVVVVSLVRNNRISIGEDRIAAYRRGIGFLDKDERNAVIFSRAERLLVVVGCSTHFRRFPDAKIADIVHHIERLNGLPKSGVRVTDATEFIDRAHWEAMQRRFNDRRARRTRAQGPTRSQADE